MTYWKKSTCIAQIRAEGNGRHRIVVVPGDPSWNVSREEALRFQLPGSFDHIDAVRRLQSNGWRAA